MADPAPSPFDDVEAELFVACACGWTVRGPRDVIVATTQEHGRDLHNMEASEQDVLAMVRPAPD